ncbi:hypothetical protein Rleg9DRAFT_1319 [Rhizobium leguminosarum bv. trifolii WSM597]|uniref:Uncharacterized protein n=1 Tax=Rhizobium leguminosarum bv. trifolii WSM597 TaxID=754764 RepID=I9N759_RHILT|nr:hypothetical protein Rleg9DRAFT_1319 [Rhizobium leguminosarum bv. trifolii WSM597]
MAILLNLALITGANASEELSAVWRDLFTRCRIAVETGKDFDATGLRDLGHDVRMVPPVTAPGVPFPLLPGHKVVEQRWEVPGSRFAVVEAEHASNRGESKRSCEIRLAQAAEPISADEEKLLRATFFVERDELLKTGRYEYWNPDPLFSTNLGIRLAGRNPNGCRVVSFLDIETRSHSESFFWTNSAEQDTVCRPTPRLVNP